MSKSFGFIPFLIGGIATGAILCVTLFAAPTNSISPSDLLKIAATPTPTETPTPTPTPTPFPKPNHLSIPAIGVEATVEQVGLDSQNAMDVPKDWMDVGWYEYGVRPGEQGNAVIDGHLDTNTGAPAIFWNLNKLQPGDFVYVTDEVGQRHTFVVKNKAQYNFNEVPMEEIFAKTDAKHLNLITCGGWWNFQTHNYSHRTVVYTELTE